MIYRYEIVMMLIFLFDIESYFFWVVDDLFWFEIINFKDNLFIMNIVLFGR